MTKLKYSPLRGGVYVETDPIGSPRCFRFDDEGRAEWASLSDLESTNPAPRWYGHVSKRDDFELDMTNTGDETGGVVEFDTGARFYWLIAGETTPEISGSLWDADGRLVPFTSGWYRTTDPLVAASAARMSGESAAFAE